MTLDELLPNKKEIKESDFWHIVCISGLSRIMNEETVNTLKIDNVWHKVIKFNYEIYGMIGGGFAITYGYGDYPTYPIKYYKWSLCDHSFSSKILGRCWTKYTCTKCQKSYEIDSSD